MNPKWSHVLCTGFSVALALATPGTVQAQPARMASNVNAPSLWDDARLRAWADDYEAGRVERVLAAVEADLRSPRPHPAAPLVWSLIHRRNEDLDVALRSAAAPLRSALGDLPTIVARWFDHDGVGLLTAITREQLLANENPFALRIAAAATHSVRPRDALALARRIPQCDPRFFWGAWETVSLLESAFAHDEPLREEVRREFTAGGAASASSTGVFVTAMLRRRGLRTIDRVRAVEEYLQHVPHDPEALRYRAEQHEDLRRWSEALDGYRSLRRVFPFLSYREEEARTLVRLGRFDEARDLLLGWAQRHQHDAGLAERAGESGYIDALIDGGERGVARERLVAALARWPSDARFRDGFARLELSGNRPAAAIEHARAALTLEAPTTARQLRLSESLRRAGRAAEARTILEPLERSTEPQSNAVYGEISAVLAAVGDPAARVSVMQRAIQNLPDDAWMLREGALALWSADRKRDAMARLQEALRIDPTSDWSADRLAEWTQELDGREAADGALRTHRAAYPWYEHGWSLAASRIEGEQASRRRIALWREAAAANPGAAWPFDHAIVIAGGEESWDELAALLSEQRTAVESGAEGDRELAEIDRVWALGKRVSRGRVPPSEIDAGLERLAELERRGGSLESVYRYRAELLQAAGRREAAGEAAYQRGLLNLRSSSTIESLFIDYYEELGERRWTLIRRMIETDPYDGHALDNARAKHVRWSGSPVMALQLDHWIQERAPDRGVYSAAALGALGWHTRSFSLGYGTSTSLANSDRYVGWFTGARDRSLADATASDAVVVNVTLRPVERFGDPVTAEITWSNGDVTRRTDHPFTGRVMRLQQGASFVSYQYDPEGTRLQRIETSAGDWITLNYEERTDRIRSMVDSEGRRIDFQYNDNGRPSHIEVAGVGAIDVTYTANGEIRNTTSTGGRGVALQVTTAFQHLLDLIRRAQIGNAVDIPHRDENLERLRRAAEARSPEASFRLAAYLVEHLRDRRRHADDAGQRLAEILREARSEQASRSARRIGLRALPLYHRLLKEIRPHGLNAEEFPAWQRIVAWAEEQTGGQAREAIQAIRREPLRLLDAARWLPRSNLVNPGLWRVHGRVDVLPRGLRERRLQTVLRRRNGDLVVGTDGGLSVLRRGYWTWYAFDAEHGHFSRDLSPGIATLRAASDVRALVEDARGGLWLGTADGVILLEGEYDRAPRRWQTPGDGLASPAVVGLGILRGSVVVGTSAGVSLISREGPGLRLAINAPVRSVVGVAPPVAAEGAAPLTASGIISPFGALTAPTDAENLVLVSTDSGIEAIGASGSAAHADDAVLTPATTEVRRIVDGPVDGLAWGPDHREIAFLRNGQVYRTEARSSAGRASSPTLLPDQENIVRQRTLHGLTTIEIEGAPSLGVLTDQGISIYRNAHFEHLRVPDRLVDRFVGLRHAASSGGNAYLLGDDALYAVEANQQRVYPGAVNALLVADDLGMTFVANENGLGVIRHDDPTLALRDLESANVRHLTRDKRGRVLFADNATVLRYDTQTGLPTELFRATVNAGAEGLPGESQITSLLAASDGTIWATAGSSVFRYRDGRRWEYNAFRHPEIFPARTDMVSRVIETIDHEIWVVCSMESHRQHRGMILDGGLLRWKGDRFERVATSNLPWFIQSYTPVDERSAIVGTSQGFARHDRNGLRRFADLGDASYRALGERRIGPLHSLFLATSGAQIGSDTFLFGTAAGVVGWRNGLWFVPDRLNWQLPDPWLAEYGGRSVNALGVDRRGRVYVGTPRGLLVYDGGGGDPASFLISSNVAGSEFDAQAFQVQSQQQLQRERDALVESLPPQHPIAQRLARIEAARNRVEALEQAAAPPPGTLAVSRATAASAAAAERTMPTGDARQRDLTQARAEQNELLLRLEREEPALRQMLQPALIRTERIQQALAEDEVLLQYLPTRERLYVRVVGRNSLQIREVRVGLEELESRALSAATQLRRPESNAGARAIVLREVTNTGTGPVEDELAWLYDQLLRPVENEIAGQRHVYVVPAGALTYVPFSALIRSRTPRVEYAVERSTFGLLSSLYMLDLGAPSSPGRGRVALFADPDGSLPSARAEVRALATLYGAEGETRIGPQASLTALSSLVSGGRVVHLATHGLLDHERPERSYLLLADGARLSMADAMTLQLPSNALVVLSACETGIGRDGLEYATLARSFMVAGASSVVATLWPVGDTSGQSLMERFHRRLVAGDDRLTALALAQRAMIRDEMTSLRDPSRWSGYVVFGRP